MAKKPISENGPENSGPDEFLDVGRRIEELIARGNEGDKYALRDLYGQASAWARGGKVPIPEPLGTWIADRLQDVSRAIDARKEYDIGRKTKGRKPKGLDMGAALSVALKVRRVGSKGRAPNPRTEQRPKMMADEVLHFMEWERLPVQKAIFRALEYMQEKMPDQKVFQEDYEKAWDEYGEQLLAERGLTYIGPKDRK